MTSQTNKQHFALFVRLDAHGMGKYQTDTQSGYSLQSIYSSLSEYFTRLTGLYEKPLVDSVIAGNARRVSTTQMLARLDAKPLGMR